MALCVLEVVTQISSFNLIVTTPGVVFLHAAAHTISSILALIYLNVKVLVHQYRELIFIQVVF